MVGFGGGRFVISLVLVLLNFGLIYFVGSVVYKVGVAFVLRGCFFVLGILLGFLCLLFDFI